MAHGVEDNPSPDAGPPLVVEDLLGPAKVDQRAVDAQRALRERPSFSIRLRVPLSLALCFTLSGSLILRSQWTLLDVERKLHFLESAGSYSSEIEQARRNEKNFLLYGTNLADARSHVRQARTILQQDADKVGAVVGRRSYATMVAHVEQYQSLLERLDGRARQGAVEAELRSHGQTMVSTAQALVTKERERMAAQLRMIQRVPPVFLTILLVPVAYIAHFLNRQLLTPIKRVLHNTERIACGDLTPILPARRCRDEFTSIALSMNRMMDELKRRQDLLVHSHKLRAVGTLTAGIAHEINNPLNNITIGAAMRKEDYDTLSDAERLARVDEIIGQTDRAERIVRNLLDFAREGEAKTEQLELRTILDETIRLAGNQLKMARVRITLSVPKSLPTIRGDRQRLDQVFLNLLLNAADAMTEGGTVASYAAPAESPGYVAIRVIDQGTGIPEHIRASIFDPFFTTKSTGKGTGLGLSVSLGIVRQHAGHIKVESEVGRGTTVTVLLPVAPAPDMAASAPGGRAPPAGRAG